jgi:serine/threonine protein kinase
LAFAYVGADRLGCQTVPELSAVADQMPPGITVDSEIYTGGQRTVYSGSFDGMAAVIKLMKAEMRNRAEREVEIGRHFDHPNLPTVLSQALAEFSLDGQDYVYFAETLVEGVPLASRSAPYSPCEALSLTAQLVSAIEYLWTTFNVVHRDIKPLNIMVRPDGRHVLLDVGIGRHVDKTTITAGPFGPGTPGYLAPEMVMPGKGRELDARTDLFLIALVAYECVYDALPFDPYAADYYGRLVSGQFELDGEMSEPLRGLFTRMLGARPHSRYKLPAAIAAVSAAREALGCS